MAVLPIIIYPNKILEQKAEEIEDSQSLEIQELILNMLETLEANNGLGLAAPQVGKSVRLCIVKVPEEETLVLINPKIKSKSWKKVIEEEGCLSFPGQFFPVKRHKKVRVKALDRMGKKINIKAEGILSKALQHEIDHLDGILFIEKRIKTKK